MLKRKIVLNKDNSEKDRTICKKCFIDKVMYCIKKRYDNQSSHIKDNNSNCVGIKNIIKVFLLNLKLTVLV